MSKARSLGDRSANGVIANDSGMLASARPAAVSPAGRRRSALFSYACAGPLLARPLQRSGSRPQRALETAKGIPMSLLHVLFKAGTCDRSNVMRGWVGV
jgi:hypothetical protein